MGPIGDLIFVIIVLGGLAAWVVWGWKSWFAQPQAAWLSVWGFLMASLSATLQIASGAYAQFVSVPFNSPAMLWIYFIGFSLAFVGFVCGLGGLFEKSALRFKTPSLSAILLLLWFWHAMAE